MIRFIDLNMSGHLLLFTHRPILRPDVGFPHIGIQRTPLQQFFLLSAIHNPAFFQHDNLICVLNGGKAVGDHKKSFTL